MPFDPRQLGLLIGSMGGNPAFQRGYSRAMQELQQRKAQEQQLAQQQSQEDRAQQQLMLQSDQNTRANAADTRAQQDQLLQSVASLRGLLEDPTIDDPAVYDQRQQFANALAPRLGVDAGFIQSLRPAPTVFQQRAAKKKLKEIEDTYSAPQMAMLEADDASGAAPVFIVNGEKLTIGQLRERAGTAAMVDGKAMSMRPAAKPDVATPGSFEEYVGLPPEMQATRRQQRKDFLQADDRAQTGGALSGQERRVNAIADSFKSEPMVRSTTTVAEAFNFVQSLSDTSTNPADDQALIYAFAKAQDPESVVREGEYQTVQKYSQSWLDNFKFNAMRVLNNQEFLTPQARQQMKKVIQQRYQSRRQQYDNIRRSYAQQINKVTGRGDGETHLIDYAGAFPAVDPATLPPAAGGAPAGTATPAVTYQDYLKSRQR